jgi:tetratricopeptide (TPR) repeat protein
MQEHAFEEAIHLLVQQNFIVQVSEHAFAFKNSMLWSGVFDVIKHDERYEELSSTLFSIYSQYTLSSNSIVAVVTQNINQNLTALNYWTENTKIASYIGDTNLYAISQKQCLVLIDKLENVNGSLIKNNIYERLGKLLAKSNPKEAIEYLPNAIANVRKTDNVYKEIELTGYLASCCINLGDYYGTIECVDATIAKLDYDLDLEIAMLKSRKLDALLNIGNSGEIVNLIDNEIMPVFDKYIANAKPHKHIPLGTLYEAWLQTWLLLANALIMQGNNRSFEVLTTMFEIFKRNNFEEPLFICKTKLALAFANTIKGYVDVSEEILGELIKVYKTDIMDNEAISRWNLINVLNNFMQKKYSGLKEELFQVVTFANNINDNFTKNILKTMLGKLFKDEENAKRALEIYGEQVTYFSKEKNAIGALLTWYFIAEAKLIAEGPEKSLEVSQKALEVAQSSKIHNYFFIIQFNKVIAEAFMAQAEYGFAKVHLEKAIMMARKFELLNLLCDLYLMYGKYLQDMALTNTDAQEDYVIGASKMYKKALLLAQGIKNSYLTTQIEKAKAVLNSFCQLNGIQLKDA